MKIAPVAEVKAHFSSYLKDCEQELVIITKNGRPSAALIPIEEEDDIERLAMAYSPRLRAILETSRQEIAQAGSVSHEEFWADETES